VWASAGLVLALGSEDRWVHLADGLREWQGGGSGQELEGDVALIVFGRGDRHGSGYPSGAKMPCRRKPQKNRDGWRNNHSRQHHHPRRRFEVAGLSRDLQNRVAQMLGGDRQKPPVRRYAHDRLGDTQRHGLCVCDALLGVLSLLRQEIVGRDINAISSRSGRRPSRPLRVGGWLLGTDDVDPAARNPH
jgi:hypothetical protein